MVFVTEKQVRKNFRKAGFKAVDVGVVELVNKAAVNYVRNTLEKALQKNKNAQELEASHIANAQGQKGGRVLMPAEYFGVATNHYIEPGPKTFGTDMSVTAEQIRPPFSAALSGGAKAQPQFEVAMSTVKNIATEVMKRSPIAIRQSAIKQLQASLSDELSQVVKSLQRRVGSQAQVSKKELQGVLAMKKYRKMC